MTPPASWDVLDGLHDPVFNIGIVPSRGRIEPGKGDCTIAPSEDAFWRSLDGVGD